MCDALTIGRPAINNGASQKGSRSPAFNAGSMMSSTRLLAFGNPAHRVTNNTKGSMTKTFCGCNNSSAQKVFFFCAKNFDERVCSSAFRRQTWGCAKTFWRRQPA
jgi:hypothetical protein